MPFPLPLEALLGKPLMFAVFAGAYAVAYFVRRLWN